MQDIWVSLMGPGGPSYDSLALEGGVKWNMNLSHIESVRKWP